MLVNPYFKKRWFANWPIKTGGWTSRRQGFPNNHLYDCPYYGDNARLGEHLDAEGKPVNFAKPGGLGSGFLQRGFSKQTRKVVAFWVLGGEISWNQIWVFLKNRGVSPKMHGENSFMEKTLWTNCFFFWGGKPHPLRKHPYTERSKMLGRVAKRWPNIGVQPGCFTCNLQVSELHGRHVGQDLSRFSTGWLGW